MEQSHLVTDSKHFNAWLEYLGKFGVTFGLSEIRVCGSWLVPVSGMVELACPECDFRTEFCGHGSYFAMSHHLDLLVPLESLRPYRRRILKVWPEFEQHWVFEDIYPRRK